MEPIIINRSLVDKDRSADNRTRFLNRYREIILQSVKARGLANDISISDNKKTKIEVPSLTLQEPVFQYLSKSTQIVPHNEYFVKGDTFLVLGYAQSSGRQGGQGTGEDDFSFNLDESEFIDIIFDGCALPSFIKKRTKDSNDFTNERAGYGRSGVPSRLSLIRSFNAASMRKIATKAVIKSEIEELEEELKTVDNEDQEFHIRTRIEHLEYKLEHLLFLDTYDLRYVMHDMKKKPISSAVIFFVLDVSGSMNSQMKTLAKNLFYLIKLFIQHQYQRTEIVFVRHTDEAKEVSEQDFFNNRESGGTNIHSALNMVNNIIDERYNPDDYNIYLISSSDGDDWNPEESVKVLREKLLKKVQLYAYAEVSDPNYAVYGGGGMTGYTASLTRAFEKNEKVKIRSFSEDGEMLGVFYSIFREGVKK